VSRGEKTLVKVGSRELALSNLDKVFYPKTGFTKGQVVEYYAQIAPVMLPHLKDRPTTLKRYPDGVEGESFFEKNCPAHRPGWVKTARVPTETRVIDFCLVNDLPTLVWVANLGALELHTPMARRRAMDRPTMVVFDLDPGPPAALLECCRVGLLLRDAFRGMGLETVVKTSGRKGLQLYVPLNTPTTYEETTPFAKTVAEWLERERPDLVVSKQTKTLRVGKVLVDWSQNTEHKTTVCVYSMRAHDRPTASAPVTWAEVEGAVAGGSADRLVFEAEALVRRVAEQGDLFAPALTLKQKLPKGEPAKKARPQRSGAAMKRPAAPGRAR
jgi:bifunctional non-homologous end joining protein LigD